jgi:putrescine---pyruvate transaminase
MNMRLNVPDIKAWNGVFQFHPFADPNAIANDRPLIIESGKRAIVSDTDGKDYIDGQGGLWNVSAGHVRREIIDAIKEQVETLQFYSIFGGTTHPKSIELPKLLDCFCCSDDTCCFHILIGTVKSVVGGAG